MQETGRNETFALPGGGELKIYADPTGLFFAHSEKGGVPPQLASEKFTTYRQARAAVERHIESKTKVEYPERAKANAIKK